MEVTLKFGSFEKSGAKFIGIINGEKIEEIKGDIFTEKYDLTGNSYDISELKILPPVIPSSMLALAKNYGSHLQGEAPPKQPEPFFKTTSSIAGHNDEIIIPRDSKKVDAESELVVVIGKLSKNVPQDKAYDHIFGYTCGNDVSARDWQKEDKSWWRAKSSDSFSPIGPYIETNIDPENLQITGKVNGNIVQSCNTSEMIWSIPKTIEFITKYVTLFPGDCIFTGTSGTAGQINPGDSVEIEINGIGSLVNRCV
jgi:2-keto-4-pentenoate hydratase/2-oxohepta-3-ene-1,7-dioic acid hydratase in catechol pathway